MASGPGAGRGGRGALLLQALQKPARKPGEEQVRKHKRETC